MNMPYVIKVAIVAIIQVDIAPPLLALALFILSACAQKHYLLLAK